MLLRLYIASQLLRYHRTSISKSAINDYGYAQAVEKGDKLSLDLAIAGITAKRLHAQVS